MRKIQFKYIALASLLVALTIYSCNKDIIKPVAEPCPSAANKAGIDGLLIGLIRCWMDIQQRKLSTLASSMDNWVYGGVASDDAFKGSNTTDQPLIPALANHSVTASNIFLQDKWWFCYNAIQRANDVIREIPLVTDGSVTPEYAAEVIAEARFLALFSIINLQKCGKMFHTWEKESPMPMEITK